MLKKVLSKLDQWIQNENLDRKKNGGMLISACEIKILGQTALIEAKLDLELAATADVDVYTNMDFIVRKQLDLLLSKFGKFLDPDGDFVWMPKETQYVPYFSGKYIKASLAKPEYILESSPPASNTLGCTIPQGISSTQPLCLHTLQPCPPQIKHLTSSSNPGSTKGKYPGRRRTSTWRWNTPVSKACIVAARCEIEMSFPTTKPSICQNVVS